MAAGFRNVDVSSTLTSRGLLLRIHRDEQGRFVVSDVVGLRYGYGGTLREALDFWLAQLDDILEIPESDLGDPLRSEVRAYMKALA